jgi:GGDEF domain-containing protein
MSACTSEGAHAQGRLHKGLPDIELRALEDAPRGESMRRHIQREVERAVERERESANKARLCEICLDNPNFFALNCGHQACAGCAERLANCLFVARTSQC